MQETKITRSCGNVFADIGLPNADELLSKAHEQLQFTVNDQTPYGQIIAIQILDDGDLGVIVKNDEGRKLCMTWESVRDAINAETNRRMHEGA